MSHLVLVFVAAPAVLILGLVLLRQPMRIALPVYAALIPFGSGLSVGATRYGSLSSLVGLWLGVGLVLQLTSARRAAVRLSPTVPVWLLLLGVAGATASWSIAPQTTISGFFILASLVLIYVLISLTPVDAVVLRRTENGLLAGGLVATCYGVTQLLFLGGFPSDVPGVGPAPDGRFGNDLLGPDNEAVALLLPLVISLSRCVTDPSRVKRVLYGLLSVLLLGGILMTGSRGGILAVVVSGFALVLAIPREARLKMLAYGVIGLAVAALVWVYHPVGIAVRTTETTTSSSGRTDIWQVGLAACPRYCAFGSGWETFPDVYAATQASVPGAKVLVGKGGSYQPHNVWLLIAIELGLPGLILLASGLLLTFSEALHLPI
ncbi:MAG: O-antigen ligase family protein, partial [Propionibacteriales bacterium]|nr:O-antigen ligase family protein [Propionibacteriales bacterium]